MFDNSYSFYMLKNEKKTKHETLSYTFDLQTFILIAEREKKNRITKLEFSNWVKNIYSIPMRYFYMHKNENQKKNHETLLQTWSSKRSSALKKIDDRPTLTIKN